MKLLIVTQSVDREDPILGFFHRWIEEFAAHVDHLTVIGQRCGDYALPDNVTVLTLGKESGRGTLVQIFRFWFLLWRERRRYDAVFVHMTPVWVVLGYPLLRLLGKRVYLWYEVRRGGWMLRLAVWCVSKVFSATAHGLSFASQKNLVLGHGIDTQIFSPDSQSRDEHLLCAVGRITRIKRVELFLHALAALPPPYRLSIAGGTITDNDHAYLAELEALMRTDGLSGRVEMRFLAHRELPAFLRRASFFLHAAGGGLDKALLEAMACGCLVVSASEAAIDILPSLCNARPEEFADRVQAVLGMSEAEKRALRADLRERVVRAHSLPVLIERIRREMGEG